MRATTRGILKKTPQSFAQREETPQSSVNVVGEQDPTYGFAGRYSDSKSYFRTQNVDNTIPRAVPREDLLPVYASSQGNINHRDVLFPLRASNGSNKSNTASEKLQDVADDTTIWSLPISLREDFQNFNILTPPQKKRVKFDQTTDILFDQQQPPFEFPRETTTTSVEGPRNSLRERIYDFFANLF